MKATLKIYKDLEPNNIFPPSKGGIGSKAYKASQKFTITKIFKLTLTILPKEEKNKTKKAEVKIPDNKIMASSYSVSLVNFLPTRYFLTASTVLVSIAVKNALPFEIKAKNTATIGKKGNPVFNPPEGLKLNCFTNHKLYSVLHPFLCATNFLTNSLTNTDIVTTAKTIKKFKSQYPKTKFSLPSLKPKTKLKIKIPIIKCLISFFPNILFPQ